MDYEARVCFAPSVPPGLLGLTSSCWGRGEGGGQPEGTDDGEDEEKEEELEDKEMSPQDHIAGAAGAGRSPEHGQYVYVCYVCEWMSFVHVYCVCYVHVCF